MDMVSFFLAVACYITVHKISLTTLPQQSNERWLRMMANDLQILSITDKRLIL